MTVSSGEKIEIPIGAAFYVRTAMSKGMFQAAEWLEFLQGLKDGKHGEVPELYRATLASELAHSSQWYEEATDILASLPDGIVPRMPHDGERVGG